MFVLRGKSLLYIIHSEFGVRTKKAYYNVIMKPIAESVEVNICPMLFLFRTAWYKMIIIYHYLLFIIVTFEVWFRIRRKKDSRNKEELVLNEVLVRGSADVKLDPTEKCV
jgi:uncharacterized membrane protein